MDEAKVRVKLGARVGYNQYLLENVAVYEAKRNPDGSWYLDDNNCLSIKPIGGVKGNTNATLLAKGYKVKNSQIPRKRDGMVDSGGEIRMFLVSVDDYGGQEAWIPEFHLTYV